ncbi:MAG: hypothetical protein NTX25_15875, partial [Proteobacteria bacterium]|nr:hypothetical protein [Pseudomonadota bacterium]
YGQGASSLSLGNAGTAGGPTAYAAYSNPALLIEAEQNEISSNVMLAQFHLQDLAAGDSGHLPQKTDRSAKASDLKGASLGINLKLSDDLHFGLASYLPEGSIAHVKAHSRYDMSYLRYSQQQQRPAAYTALALKLPFGLALGIGAYYSVKAHGLLQVAIDSQESAGRMDIVLEPVVIPYAGLSWKLKALTIAAFYREAQKSTSQIDSSMSFSTESGMLPFEASSSLIPFYDPKIVRLGLAWKDDTWLLLTSFEHASWSDFQTPVLNITGTDVAALSVENRPTEVGLRDTRALRFGLETHLTLGGDRTVFRCGLEIHSSANQSAKPSYVVDPERHSLAIGSSYRWPSDGIGHNLSLEAAFQYTQLAPIHILSPQKLDIHLHGRSSIQTWMGGLQYAL